MRTKPAAGHVILTVALAFVFWYLTFSVKWMNFWQSMSIAVVTLTGMSVYFAGMPLNKQEINLKNVVIGVVSAGVLYGIFAAGNYLSQLMFNFARPEISAIYDIRHEGHAKLIAFVLLFITSPGEELFWRAFVQRWTMDKFGCLRGWLIGAMIYAGVHILSGNFMLTMAALVAGLFWGFLYWKSGSAFACIISHALWTVSIFILWPIL